MGILTIGLLGVAAIFPVGSFYLQKGETADQGSALAQSTFNEVVARGWLNPERWLVFEDATGVTGLPLPPGALANSFSRPFANMLRKQKAYQRTNSTWLATANETFNQRYTAAEFGSVFIIDPMSVAGVAMVDPATEGVIADGANGRLRYCGVFPVSTASWNNLLPNLAANSKSPWKPWVENLAGPRWPIRRVTFRQPHSSSFYKAWDPTVASRMFSAQDDLALELPALQDRPSIQRWELADTDGDGKGDQPLARQSRGDYSWIVTVAPTTAEARDALAIDPAAHYYEVSVVVFHKRPVELVSPTDANTLGNRVESLVQNERNTKARIVSTGLSGGEVLLERFPAPTGSSVNPGSEPKASPFDILKVGNWIMLCGPHPGTSPERPMMVARWYRVLSIEGEHTRLNDQGDESPPPPASDPERRLVALRGPQWPWQPNNDPSQLSNQLYVCITTGAVAVHAKTIRLEGNSVFSGGASAVTGSPPPGSKYGFP